MKIQIHRSRPSIDLPDDRAEDQEEEEEENKQSEKPAGLRDVQIEF